MRRDRCRLVYTLFDRAAAAGNAQRTGYTGQLLRKLLGDGRRNTILGEQAGERIGVIRSGIGAFEPLLDGAADLIDFALSGVGRDAAKRSRDGRADAASGAVGAGRGTIRPDRLGGVGKTIKQIIRVATGTTNCCGCEGREKRDDGLCCYTTKSHGMAIDLRKPAMKQGYTR